MKNYYSKIVSLILIVVMVLSTTVSGFADEAPAEEKEEVQTEQKVEEKTEEKPEPKEEPAKEEPVQEKEEPAEAPAQEVPAPAQEEQQPAEAPASTPAAAEQTYDNDGQTEETSPEADAVSVNRGAQEKALHADELTDGTYKPEDFSFTGGTGKASFTCESVIIKDGKATAVFKVSAKTMTHIFMGESPTTDEYTPLYDPKTGKMGEDVYKVNSLRVAVPVELNAEDSCAFRTTAMSKPHWINYMYLITLTSLSSKVSDDTTIPEFKPDKEDQDKEKDPTPKKKKTLKDGTYKVKATTDRKMFYLYPKEKDPATVILVKKNGKMTATITLTGSGYDYVYMGSYKNAIKKSNKSKWIKAKKVNGYYTFKIPVSKLDKKLTISPHSRKYQKQYGDTLNKDHCPWRPNKWIIFYSHGAKKVKAGTSVKTKGKASNRNGSQNKRKTIGKNDGKAAQESKYKDDSGKSTSAVNNATGLKDGVYSPDRFNWSGGSGRLAYIRCNKITVRGGKAFATIEFGSSKYDSLKANGRVYSKAGGGNAKFTIPVKLNANNTIIGRTTAMSQPHWVRYTIYIYKKGAGAGKNSNTEEGDDGHVTHTKKLSKKAPDLMGLEFKEEIKVENAELFKIYKYEKDIILIEVDQATDTALYRKEDKTDKKKTESEDKAVDDTQGNIEYDEDGKPIAKSQNEITNELYQNNVVNYLVVPKDVEVPAGLDKDCVIIQQPVKKGYIASDSVIADLSELDVLDTVSTLGMDEKDVKDEQLRKALKDEKVKALGSYEKPDYAEIIKTKTDLAVFPDDVLPEKVKNRTAVEGKTVNKAKKESEEKKKALEILQRRFSALAVPMLIDRSGDEKSTYAAAEWIKVYGAVFGQEDKAEAAYKAFTDKNKNKKLKQK